MAHWISLYWAWLLPVLASLGALVRLRQFNSARRREMISATSRRWMFVAVASAQILIWLLWLTLVYETNIWLPLGGLAAIGLTLLALRAARIGTHPGLRGFQRPIPGDGFELILQEQRLSRGGVPLRWRLTPWAPVIPALGLLAYIAFYHPERWLDFTMLGLALTAPALLTPFRRQWALPGLLVLPTAVLLSKALTLQAELPPGAWAAPITGARCVKQLRVAASSAEAWCANASNGAVYQFNLQTGVVSVERQVPEGIRVLAADEQQSWVLSFPSRNLVLLDADATEPDLLSIKSAAYGAVDPEGRLWVINKAMELSVYDGEEARRWDFHDGLLNNRINTIKMSPGGDLWAGSVSGVSWLAAGSDQWQTLDQKDGAPGSVINITFGGDDVWLMWLKRTNGLNFDWGVTALHPDKTMHHYWVGRQANLEIPTTEDALAVDGQGRLWFVTQSVVGRKKILGILTPEGDGSVALYSLGRFDNSGPYAYGGSLWETSFGVVADGEGGIIVFNGGPDPWRRWRPGWW